MAQKASRDERIFYFAFSEMQGCAKYRAGRVFSALFVFPRRYKFSSEFALDGDARFVVWFCCFMLVLAWFYFGRGSIVVIF